MLKVFLNKALTFLDPPPYLIKSKKIVAGTDSFHNGNLNIRGRGKITIGSYCAFGKNISIISENHDINFASLQGHIYKKTFNDVHPGDIEFPNLNKIKGPIEIGHDVWIGDNAVVLSGVKIGNGACIAAGSIVTKDVANFGIVGGVPAKLIKYRFSPEMIEFLVKLDWWSWDIAKRSENKEFFYTNLNEVSLDDLRKMIK